MPYLRKSIAKVCSAEGCTRQSQGALCSFHQKKASSEFSTCVHEGCHVHSRAGHRCKKHFLQNPVCRIPGCSGRAISMKHQECAEHSNVELPSNREWSPYFLLFLEDVIASLREQAAPLPSLFTDRWSMSTKRVSDHVLITIIDSSDKYSHWLAV